MEGTNMRPSAANESSPQTSLFETSAFKALFSKIDRRLIPILLIAYMIAYLDRINVGWAQLQMEQTLPFDDAIYGLGAGMFFVGYFLFGVPSNLLLERIGARKTLLGIMVIWGVAATAIIAVIAGPLCGAILKYFNGLGGLHGWQWLFMVQGVPAIVLGFLVYLLLEDKPANATWLSRDEKQLLDDGFQHDVKDVESEPPGTFGQMLRDPKVYVLSLVYCLLLGATYTLVFWMPTLIQSWGIKDLFLVGI